MEDLVSKGFLLFAQNTKDVDYIIQAYALALSIQFSQTDVKSVSLITNDPVPDEYRSVFDQIIPIPWFDETQDSILKTENRWKFYYATPYDETIVLDTDMLLLKDISTWWNYCSNYDVKFCSKILNYKQEQVLEDTFHRKTFISNNLSNPYFALHYFKKNEAAFEFYKVLEFVITNWEFCRGTFAPLDPQEWSSMDLATAIAIEISGMWDTVVDELGILQFVHMKTPIQGWESTPSSWRNFVNYMITDKGDFVVGNIKQAGLFHYVEKDFINQSVLKRLKELAYGS